LHCRLQIIIDKYTIAVVCHGKIKPITKLISSKMGHEDLCAIANGIIPIQYIIDTLDLYDTYWEDDKLFEKFTDNFLYNCTCVKETARDEKYTSNFFAYLFDL